MKVLEVYPKTPSGRAFPSAVNMPVPCRPPPRPLRDCLLLTPGPERNLYDPAPVLYRLAPRSSYVCLQMSFFVTTIPTKN
jgi:hypothetical protein